MNNISYYSVDKIKAIDYKYYVKEGYGGKHIKYFPPCHFFILFLDGKEKKSIDRFCKWYDYMFLKYFNVSKKVGGMKNGSLYKLIKKNHKKNNIKLKEDLSNIDKIIYNKSIKERVMQRFDLLKSIRDNGYNPGNNFIEGIFKDKLIYLIEGHHRCASLYALGDKKIQIRIRGKE